MSVRVKKKRRLVFLVGGLLLAGSLAAGVYLVRMRQKDAAVAARRVEGVAALAAGDHENALHKIGTYLQRYPEDADTIYLYAQARQGVEEPDGKHVRQAISLYRRLLSLRPDHNDGRLKLLDLYVKSGLNTEALDLTAGLLAKNPKDATALRAQAVSYARLRRFDEALAASTKHNELVPTDLEVQGLTFQVMLAKGQKPDALVAHAKKLHDAKPGLPEFELLCSAAAASAGDQKAAADWARKAAAHPKDDPTFLSMLAAQLDAVGLFDESLGVLQAAARGGKVEVRRALAARLVQADRFADVADSLKALDPADKNTDGQLLALRALALGMAGRRAEAAPLIAAIAARRDAASLTWHPVLRAVYGSDKADDTATVGACEAALGRDPGNPFFAVFLGDAYARLGEGELALTNWQRAARAATAWPAPLTRLSTTLGSLGRRDQSVAAARAARARAPKDPANLLQLALALDAALVTVTPELTTELADVLAALDRVSPNNEQALPARIHLLAVKPGGGESAAAAAARAAIAADKVPSEATLMRLAMLSRALKLGVDQACFDRIEKAYGVTPDLAYVRAVALAEQGKAADGGRLIDAASAAAKAATAKVAPATTAAAIAGGPSLNAEQQWLAVRAKYLDYAKDARAKDAWVKLADAYPADVQLQWAALGSPSVKTDRTFLTRAIDRLRTRIGSQGTNWRLARVSLLMMGERPAEKDATEAATLLGEVIRAAPDMVGPRLMLAKCLEVLHNLPGAIEQLTTAADMNPAAASVGLDLARLLGARGEYDKAADVLERVVRNQAATPAERRAAIARLIEQGQGTRAVALADTLNLGSADGSKADLVVVAIHRQKGDVAKAEAGLKELLLKDPTDAALRYAADFYASQNRPADAEAALAMLDKLASKPGVKELIRGEHYARHGDAKRAGIEFDAAVKADPKNPVAWRQLIRYQLAAGQADKALESAARAVAAIPAEAAEDRQSFAPFTANAKLVTEAATNPAASPLIASLLESSADDAPAVEALKLLADEKKLNGNTGPWLAKLTALADRNPKLLPLQTLAAARLMAAGQTETGWKIATRAMYGFPVAPEPAQLAAAGAAKLGRWDEVLAAAAQWHQRSPGAQRQADLLLATAHLERGEAVKSLAILKPYLPATGAPATAPAGGSPALAADQALQALYGRALVASGKEADAAQLLVPMLNRSAEWREAWLRIAATQVADAKTAADWINQAAALMPADALSERVTLAWAWYQLATRTKLPEYADKAAEVRRDCRTRFLAATQPSSPAIAMTLGMLDDTAGDAAGAEAMYRAVLKDNPNSPIIRNNLAMVLAKRDDRLHEALELAAAAAAAAPHPNRANFRETLATVQAKMKRYEESIASLNLALQEQPHNVSWRIRLAHVLSDSGDMKRAKAALNQVEALNIKESELPVEARQQLREVRQKLSGMNSANSIQYRGSLS